MVYFEPRHDRAPKKVPKEVAKEVPKEETPLSQSPITLRNPQMALDGMEQIV